MLSGTSIIPAGEDWQRIIMAFMAVALVILAIVLVITLFKYRGARHQLTKLHAKAAQTCQSPLPEDSDEVDSRHSQEPGHIAHIVRDMQI